MQEQGYSVPNLTRIRSLDLIRGFAILGILIMNIISFSDVGISYINPTQGAGLESYNAWFHGFGYLFADSRFMSLFSMLFGAGILIFANNAIQKAKSATKLHYRRMFLLLIFGFIHAYLIWMGDILVAYAICGSFVFLLRKKNTRTLLVLAVIFFCIPPLLSLLNYFITPAEILEEIYSFFYPSEYKITQELTAYRSGYFGQMEARIAGAIELQTLLFFMESMWRVLSMMLLGMILFRKGVLSGTAPSKVYSAMLIYGWTGGLLISAIGLYGSYQSNWDSVWVMSIGSSINYIASLFMALGYLAFLIRLSKSMRWESIKIRLEAVGRLAFTNYILSSVICTFIFYGHGLGYFGHFDRLGQYMIVLLVWLVILIISPFILSKWKQGPLERLWRNLTYFNQ